MDVLIIVLRLIHILTGVFWAGTAFFLVSFLTPAIQAAGPEGGKVMQRLALSRFPRALPGAAVFTVLSGLVMYWDKYIAVNLWSTRAGIGFAFGGAMGLIAVLIGLLVTAPATMSVAAIAKELIATGKPPSPTQMQEIQSAQIKLASGAIWNAMFLGLAVAAMAI